MWHVFHTYHPSLAVSLVLLRCSFFPYFHNWSICKTKQQQQQPQTHTHTHTHTKKNKKQKPTQQQQQKATTTTHTKTNKQKTQEKDHAHRRPCTLLHSFFWTSAIQVFAIEKKDRPQQRPCALFHTTLFRHSAIHIFINHCTDESSCSKEMVHSVLLGSLLWNSTVDIYLHCLDDGPPSWEFTSLIKTTFQKQYVLSISQCNEPLTEDNPSLKTACVVVGVCVCVGLCWVVLCSVLYIYSYCLLKGSWG